MKIPRYVKALLVVLGVLILLPSGCVALFGGFSREVVFSEPVNAAYRIDLTKRVVFPANEFLDPSVRLELMLIDQGSSAVLAHATTKLSEDSDYVTPRLVPTGRILTVVGFDRRDPKRALTVSPPAQAKAPDPSPGGA